MSLKINSATFTGRITHDVEVRVLPGTDRAVVDAQVAIDDSYWDGKAEENRKQTSFINITLYGPRAAALGKFVAKGKLLYFEGKLASAHWEDKASGEKRSRTFIEVAEWQFAEPKAADKPTEAQAATAG